MVLYFPFVKDKTDAPHPCLRKAFMHSDPNWPRPPAPLIQAQRLSWREGFRRYLQHDRHKWSLFRLLVKGFMNRTRSMLALAAFTFLNDWLLTPLTGSKLDAVLFADSLYWVLLVVAFFKLRSKVELYRNPLYPSAASTGPFTAPHRA